MQKIIQKIKKIIDENKFSYTKILQNDLNLKKYIIESTLKLNFLKDKNIFKVRCYWIYHDIKDFPTCPICHKQYGFDYTVASINRGYPPTCANKICRLKFNKQKAIQTCMRKYGVDNPAKSDLVKEKIKKTNLQKYGTECSLQNKEVKEKIKKTNLQKYGVDNPLKSDSIKEKIKKINLKKYGVDNPMKSKLIFEKFKAQRIKNNGKYTSDKELQKRKQTILSLKEKDLKYQQKINDKIKHTVQSKYKINFVMQSEKFKNNWKLTRYKNIYENIKELNSPIPLFNYDQFVASHCGILHWKCEKCGNEFQSYLIKRSLKNFNHFARCPKCYPEIRSIQESNLAFFIQNELKQYIIQSCRSVISPLELDIYIPDKKLAIEFDGLYWHSDLNQNKNYHLNKTEACEKLGIQLIHIFENEWVLKQDIVKSRLKSFLGMYDKIVFARKCEVKEIGNKEAKEFLDMNHIQGNIKSLVNFGLYFKNELISLMTFGKSRFNKNIEWELLRFCNKLNYHVPGAAGKLLKYFERNFKPKSLVSYADRRWSMCSGKTVYQKIGFKFEYASKPAYWYWNAQNLNLQSRLKFQKYKLKNILEKFDEKLTESENMKLNGYHKIYDCGNLVFVKNYF